MSKPKPKPIAPKGASKPNIIVLNPPKGKRLLAKNIKPVKAGTYGFYNEVIQSKKVKF